LPARRSKYDWPGLVARLKRRPGEWGSLVCGTAGSARSMAYQINQGKHPAVAFLGGRFEARSRTGMDGDAMVYVRYLGEVQP
jgi:hypothetical protein